MSKAEERLRKEYPSLFEDAPFPEKLRRIRNARYEILEKNRDNLNLVCEFLVALNNLEEELISPRLKRAAGF
jgi:hypothetical protein